MSGMTDDQSPLSLRSQRKDAAAMEALSDLPISLRHPEFTAALRKQAVEDADAVGLFLRHEHLAPPDGNATVELPATLLLGLGIALRFRSWELQNIRVHLDAGLPSGTELLTHVIEPAPDHNNLAHEIRSLAIERIRLLQESFLWSVPDDSLQTDIAIIGDSDEAFLDAVTDFLINHLHKGA